MKTDVFWRDSLTYPYDLNTIKEIPASMDVAIIGSGYTGLTAARTLLKSGASVVVFEKETIGWGASSRNGGMASPGLKQGIEKIFKKYGADYGREVWQASVDAIDMIEQIVTEENIECDWSRDGHVALAYKASHFKEFEKFAVWLDKELGHSVDIIPKGNLSNEIGSDAYYGGFVDPLSAGIHPAKYVYGLARAVTKAGGLLCEKTAVIDIKKTTQGFEVTTPNGSTIAKEVILATNGYADDLIPAFRSRVIPIGSYIITTEPLPPALCNEISPHKRMFYDSKWFIHYFRLTPDGRMLWGGRNKLSAGHNLVDSGKILEKQMHKVFPALKEYQTTHSWSGVIGVPFDLMPHIGQINGIHYACGYAGHGLSIATYLGTELGLRLSGQKLRSPFEEISHPTRFYYQKKPWFLTFAEKYYRVIDKVF